MHQIGLDTMVGMYGNHTLSKQIINKLHNVHIVHINQICKMSHQNLNEQEWFLNGQEWLTSEELGFHGFQDLEWRDYV